MEHYVHGNGQICVHRSAIEVCQHCDKQQDYVAGTVHHFVFSLARTCDAFNGQRLQKTCCVQSKPDSEQQLEKLSPYGRIYPCGLCSCGVLWANCFLCLQKAWSNPKSTSLREFRIIWTSENHSRCFSCCGNLCGDLRFQFCWRIGDCCGVAVLLLLDMEGEFFKLRM